MAKNLTKFLNIIIRFLGLQSQLFQYFSSTSENLEVEAMYV